MKMRSVQREMRGLQREMIVVKMLRMKAAIEI